MCCFVHKYDLEELQSHPGHLDENRKQFECKIANLSVKLSNLFANCVLKICALQANGIPMQLNVTREHPEHGQ